MSARSLLLVVGIAALTACARGERAPDAADDSAAPNVVALSATEYEFRAPDSIAAGWTTFRLVNDGAEVHYGHIVQLEAGRTVQEMADAYLEAIRTSGPRPSWVRRFGGPGGARPGESSSVTQFLEPGSYVWICPVEDDEGHPHFAKGEVKPFVVHAAPQPSRARANAPEATMQLRLADYTFVPETPLRSGRHVIRVENVGKEPHDLVLLRLAPGITIDDVRRVMNPESARRDDQPSDSPPPVANLGSLAGGHAAIAPGMEAYLDVDLTPGDYALVCMVTAADGRAHIEHGMIQRGRVE